MKTIKYILAVIAICLISKIIANIGIENLMRGEDFEDAVVRMAYFGFQLFVPSLVALVIITALFLARRIKRFRPAALLWLCSAVTTWVSFVYL